MKNIKLMMFIVSLLLLSILFIAVSCGPKTYKALQEENNLQGGETINTSQQTINESSVVEDLNATLNEIEDLINSTNESEDLSLIE